MDTHEVTYILFASDLFSLYVWSSLCLVRWPYYSIPGHYIIYYLYSADDVYVI